MHGGVGAAPMIPSAVFRLFTPVIYCIYIHRQLLRCGLLGGSRLGEDLHRSPGSVGRSDHDRLSGSLQVAGCLVFIAEPIAAAL